jgi:hypothetical protein
LKITVSVRSCANTIRSLANSFVDLVLEFVDGGDLLDFIVKERGLRMVSGFVDARDSNSGFQRNRCLNTSWRKFAMHLQ